jgi:hypothetical protein
VSKSVARQLATAVLWVRIQTSLKIINGLHKRRSGRHTLYYSPPKKIYKQFFSCIQGKNFLNLTLVFLYSGQKGFELDLSFPVFWTKSYEDMHRIGVFTQILFCFENFRSQCTVIQTHRCKIGLSSHTYKSQSRKAGNARTFIDTYTISHLLLILLRLRLCKTKDYAKLTFLSS